MNNNQTPGNKSGGLTTILEKSLGAAAKGGKTYLLGLAGMHVTDSRIDTFDLPPQATTPSIPFKDATKFTGRGEGIRKDSAHGAPLIRLSNFSKIEYVTLKLDIPGQPSWQGPVTKCE